jgi:hypothetical protein
MSILSRGWRWIAFTSLLLCGALGADEPAEKAQEADWQSLFDGKSLERWEVIEKGEFSESGNVVAKEGSLVLEAGKPATGVRLKGPFPTTDFEVALEGKRLKGGDFFCGLTFPVGDGSVSLILGGWGGWVVGLSCIDGHYAIDNNTVLGIPFERDRWYKVRVRVTKADVRVWVNDEEIIELETKGHEFAASEEMKTCLPLGLATWNTTGALRNIRYRKLKGN